MIQGLLRGVSIAGATAPDQFFSSVVLLLGFEGADGSTGAPGNFDESPAAHGVAGVVAGTISTAQAKFGNSSYHPTGAVGGWIYGDSADWLLSSANSDQFTIDVSIRVHTLASNKIFVCQYSIDGTYSWTIQLDISQVIKFGYSSDGTFASEVALTGSVPTADTWYQVAIDKDSGGKIRLYVGGVMVASTTPANSSFFNSTVSLGIGATATGGGPLDGFIDELRITKGVARYASDAGYTPATAAFPRS